MGALYPDLHLTLSDYNSLLSPVVISENKQPDEGSTLKQRISKGNWSYAIAYLKVIVNRIAYFIFSGFRYFPTDAFLFEQFKNYKFEQVRNSSHHRTLSQLFNRFKVLGLFKKEEINDFEEKLKSCRSKFLGNGSGILSKSRDVELQSSLLLTDLSQISNLIDELHLFQKLTRYETNKVQLIKDQPSSTPLFQMDITSYRNLSEDQADLSLLKDLLNRWQASLKTYHGITSFFSCPLPTHSKLASQLLGISAKLEKICALFRDLYSQQPLEQNAINQIEQIEQELHKESAIEDLLLKLKNGQLQSNPNSNSDFEIESAQEGTEDAQELDFEWIDQLEESDSSVKRLVRGALYHTVLYPLKDSEKEIDLKWKIERYEEVINIIYKVINTYLSQQSLSIQKMIERCESKEADLWEQQLYSLVKPLADYSKQDLGEDRIQLTYLKNLRQFYNEKVIGNLRHAAKWAREHPDQRNQTIHIHAICHGLYTGVNFNQKCQKILKEFCGRGEKKAASSPADFQKGLIANFDIIDQQIEAAPTGTKQPKLKQWMTSAISHFNGIAFMNAMFDPNTQANFAHVILEMVVKQGKEVARMKDIAMGTPTIEKGNAAAEINEEFLGMLRYYQQTGGKHLYVNLQSFIPKSRMLGDETARCKAIQNLTQGEFKEIFYAITLSKNSDFYEQKNTHFKSIQEFKSGLINDFFDRLPTKEEAQRLMKPAEMNKLFKDQGQEVPEDVYDAKKWPPEIRNLMHALVTGNYIPRFLADRFDLKNWMGQVFDLVHANLFDGKKKLDKKNRKILVELCQHLLVFKLLVELKPNSYNVSCKDRADRGPAADAGLFACQAYVNNQENDTQVREFFETIVFSRAIIVKKRSIIHTRLTKLMKLVTFLQMHKKPFQQIFEKIFQGIHIQAIPTAE